MNKNRRLAFETLESRQALSVEGAIASFHPLGHRSIGSLAIEEKATGTPSIDFAAGEQSSTNSASPRNNRVNRFDVNRDGLVTPIDVLATINVLNRSETVLDVRQIHEGVVGYFDVNSDFMVTPFDILQTINFLNSASGDSFAAEVKPITYAIGNSLTGDMIFILPEKGFDSITRNTSTPTRTGVHLNCGQTLHRIVQNPDENCGFIEPFGKYRQALAQPVDNVFLQPHDAATIAEEIQAMKDLIDYTRLNPENHDTRFFLYAPWGGPIDYVTGLPFYESWLTHQATLNGPYVASESTFDLMQNELTRSGYSVQLISAGHTFVAIIDAIRSGTQIELLANENDKPIRRAMLESELWRDVIHASDIGKYVAGLSAYAALYSKAPRGIDPVLYVGSPSRLGTTLPIAEGTRMIEQMVWNTYLLQR